jgi:hypothetical protein
MPVARGFRRQSLSPRAGMLFFAIFLAFGLMGTYVGVSAYLDVQEVDDWPSTTGTVTDVGVSENFVSGHKGSSSHYEYYPQVAYTYQVDGATYYGNDLAKIQSSYQSYADAQGHLDQYGVGSEVTVYYNPDDPNEAVLEQNSQTEALLFPGIGALFLVIGAVGFIYFFKKWRA